MLDLLIDKTSSKRIMAFQASPEIQMRVSDLLEKNRSQGLSPDESRALDEFERREHLVRMLKARARQKLPS
ncbi:MAG TPA: hypothetical protein DIT99_00245 [Candidatus Latescibacteria bacterium]|nr:hypothetical protein [Candidatus Latescibacterota bacterium]